MKLQYLFLYFCIFSNDLFSCDCKSKSITEQYHNSDLVLIGVPYRVRCIADSVEFNNEAKDSIRIKKLNKISLDNNENTIDMGAYPCEKEILVQAFQIFKGDRALFHEFFSSPSDDMCGINEIVLGKPHVFYSSSHQGKYDLNACRSNSIIYTVNDEITALRNNALLKPTLLRDKKPSPLFILFGDTIHFSDIDRNHSFTNEKYSEENEYLFLSRILGVIATKSISYYSKSIEVDKTHKDSLISLCTELINSRIEHFNNLQCSTNKKPNIEKCNAWKYKKLDTFNKRLNTISSSDTATVNTLIRKYLFVQSFAPTSFYNPFIDALVYKPGNDADTLLTSSLKQIINSEITFLYSGLKQLLLNHSIIPNKVMAKPQKHPQNQDPSNQIIHRNSNGARLDKLSIRRFCNH